MLISYQTVVSIRFLYNFSTEKCNFIHFRCDSQYRSEKFRLAHLEYTANLSIDVYVLCSLEILEHSMPWHNFPDIFIHIKGNFKTILS